MKSKYLFVALIAFSTCSLALTAQHDTAPNPQKNKAAVAAPATTHKQEEGSRIFDQNCSRCHNAPQGFSPRISGTVVQHMRTRASLSKHDQEELLRFLNP